MKQYVALQRFSAWDLKGRCIYTLRDISRLFPEDNMKTLQASLTRLIAHGILERVARGVFKFSYSSTNNSYLIEEIAKTLRRGCYSYISLESALSAYGAISQIPIDRLTVMTTGRKGLYHTPYGIIEFTHTKRSVTDILSQTAVVGMPLRLATSETAWRDLKRVGRNTHLVNEEVLKIAKT